ncbi:DUF6431 domain-containing protein [Virgibacillus siamensis]|uniref:DUF6431 domain-containing protein n=1 Tax=Virgibacillus siamensis TaxID=480071 RepID=UPI002481A223|nr:DUF6431 domain-containing protein [Virgibacillus siamensis]
MSLAFFVRSAEINHCPCCEGPLIVAGSRRRVWYRHSGDKAKLIIRRLFCERCHKIHHELPDLLVPYKRYGTESIEQVLDDQLIDVPADESTLGRWREWFRNWGPYAVGCFNSIIRRFQLDLPVGSTSDPPRTVLQRIGRNGESFVGWLAKVVRPIVNVHLWVQTRSAFLSKQP